MKQSILITRLMLGTILRSVKNQIMNNVVMPAIFIAVTFLPIGEVGGQTVEVELQRSADMEDWETVAITQDLLSEKGTVRQPAGENAGFFRLRIKSVEEAPSGMALIPAGSFTMGMGDTVGEGNSDERAERLVHMVNVPAFFMQARETTKAEWDEVRAWALENGYAFDYAGEGKAADHPVHTVNWYDVVKWCNARSEKEGLTPCYYLEDAHTSVYRTGTNNLTNTMVDWGANGYRLPTEAEWEKAARGGLQGRRFPWGDTITHALANYNSVSRIAYDTSPTRGYHPDWDDGTEPKSHAVYTSPVGSFPPNGYGLFDMTGNVWEWCWDRYGNDYYADSPVTAPVGPDSGSDRVVRGGSWRNGAEFCRSDFRLRARPSDWFYVTGYGGFRPARGQ